MTIEQITDLYLKTKTKVNLSGYNLGHFEREDLMSDVYLKVVRYKDSYQEGTNFTSWLATITRNTFLNDVKVKNKQFSVPVETYHAITYQSSSSNNFVKNDLKVFRDTLTEVEGRILEMKIEGYNGPEIALKLNLDVNNNSRIVKAVLKKAQRALKDYKY